MAHLVCDYHGNSILKQSFAHQAKTWRPLWRGIRAKFKMYWSWAKESASAGMSKECTGTLLLFFFSWTPRAEPEHRLCLSSSKICSADPLWEFFFFFWIQQTGEVIRPEFVADEWCKIFSDGKGAVEEVESLSCLHAVFVVCSHKKVLASSWALSFHILGKPSTYCVMESLNTGIYMEVINTNPVDLVMSFSKNSVENTLVQVRLELRSFKKCSGIWLPLCWCSGTWVLLGCSLLILMGARLNV